MAYSSALGQRIAAILVLVAPLGLVNCGDDDGGSSPPPATGGTGTGGASTGGAGGAKTVTGGTGTGGAATGGATTGGMPGTAGAATGGKSAGGGGGSGGEAGGPDEVGGAGGSGGGGGEDADAGGGGEAPAGDKALNSILIGSFAPLPDYDDLDITGQALLVRTNDETRVSVQVVGLDGETEYPVHVHNLPCEFLAGTHYKIDTTVAETEEDNEVWPMFETDEDGVGYAEVVVEHPLRGDALSVVVHEPTDSGTPPKMACADLTIDADAVLTGKGTFNSFASAVNQDQTLEGTIEVERDASGTVVSYEITGFDGDEEYMAHVHALPCDEADAGGHYKIDPTEASTVEENELWLELGSTADGESSDSIESDHKARLDAQSVVIHRVVDDDTSLKVACAPITIADYPDVQVQGASVSFDAAADKGLTDIQALGSLTRSLTGETRVRVSAAGLDPDVEYMVHVHALPCSTNDGGGHYKIDREEADTVEANELWLTLATDAEGIGTVNATFEHTARADARSIVIHDPEDSAKLACIDLSH
jgi:hypothetical protein